ncbi:MAG: Txe/YoeB family addiction module toxin [Eubacterium sp.]|nr:Txe/YoeB family addiction module toxin [Eubacterium sp.]
MIKIWDDDAWEDYLYWQNQDKKTLKRVNALIKDIDRNGYEGIGKPEPLLGKWSGYWSRRIDEKNRLIYKISDNTIRIAQCRIHYGDK